MTSLTDKADIDLSTCDRITDFSHADHDRIDLNGDGLTDAMIDLTGLTSLVGGDFVLV